MHAKSKELLRTRSQEANIVREGGRTHAKKKVQERRFDEPGSPTGREGALEPRVPGHGTQDRVDTSWHATRAVHISPGSRFATTAFARGPNNPVTLTKTAPTPRQYMYCGGQAASEKPTRGPETGDGGQASHARNNPQPTLASTWLTFEDVSQYHKMTSLFCVASVVLKRTVTWAATAVRQSASRVGVVTWTVLQRHCPGFQRSPKHFPALENHYAGVEQKQSLPRGVLPPSPHTQATAR